MTGAAARFPEESASVERFRQALKGRENETLDALAVCREQLESRGLRLTADESVPLRPLFVPRARLDFLARALTASLADLGAHLAARLPDLDSLVAQLPCRDVFEALDAAHLFTRPDFGRFLRPDGFLFADRYVVTEPNMGSGLGYSTMYPDAMHAVFEASPALTKAGFAVAENVTRPMARWVDWVSRRVPASVRAEPRRPRAALFWLETDLETERDERLELFLAYFPRVLEAAGFEVCTANERELDVTASGRCVHTADGQPVDVVINLFVPALFLENRQRFEREYGFLRSDHIGHAPLLEPLDSLAVDKGTLPLWSQLPGWPKTDADGFRVELMPTHAPDPARETEYRLERERWCLKRAFVGKDTHVGLRDSARLWNRALDRALASPTYVLQPYTEMSVAELPVVRHGRIEWVDFSVELSLFVFDGVYSGSLVRAMPQGPGHIMSPPPPDLGATLVYGVPAS